MTGEVGDMQALGIREAYKSKLQVNTLLEAIVLVFGVVQLLPQPMLFRLSFLTDYTFYSFIFTPIRCWWVLQRRQKWFWESTTSSSVLPARERAKYTSICVYYSLVLQCLLYACVASGRKGFIITMLPYSTCKPCCKKFWGLIPTFVFFSFYRLS